VHLGSTLERAPSLFARPRSTGGIVSWSDFDRLLPTGRWKSQRRRAESRDHLFVEQCCEGFEIFGVGRVVPQQQVACGFVSCAPLVPQANGFPSVESHDIGLALNLDLVFDVFQPALHAEPARRKAEIEVRFLEVQSGEFRLQVGNVKSASEKRNEQVRLLQLCVQPVLG